MLLGNSTPESGLISGDRGTCKVSAIHLVSALLLAGICSVAYAQPSRLNPPNFAQQQQQQQQQVAETVSQIQLANARAQLLQQQSALLKQQELEQHRQSQTVPPQPGQEQARQQAEEYQAQRAELQAERRLNREDQHQAVLAKEQLLTALQRQQEELLHQRSAASDPSTQEKLDAQMRQIARESQELQTVQPR